MKLYITGLYNKIGDYLDTVKGEIKRNITIQDIV